MVGEFKTGIAHVEEETGDEEANDDGLRGTVPPWGIQ